MLVIILLAEFRPEDQCESTDGRDTPSAPVVPMAPVEFLGLDLISEEAEDHLSGKEATELRLLLVDDRGDTKSAGSGLVAKWVSMNERRKRFALSRGPASFSVK